MRMSYVSVGRHCVASSTRHFTASALSLSLARAEFRAAADKSSTVMFWQPFASRLSTSRDAPPPISMMADVGPRGQESRRLTRLSGKGSRPPGASKRSQILVAGGRPRVGRVFDQTCRSQDQGWASARGAPRSPAQARDHDRHWPPRRAEAARAGPGDWRRPSV